MTNTVLLIGIESMSQQEIDWISICEWQERLSHEERVADIEPLGEEVVNLIDKLVNGLPALDRAVIEMAYGFNGVTAEEDVNAICEKQDLTLEECVFVLDRSIRAVGERLLLLAKSSNRRGSKGLAGQQVTTE